MAGKELSEALAQKYKAFLEGWEDKRLHKPVVDGRRPQKSSFNRFGKGPILNGDYYGGRQGRRDFDRVNSDGYISAEQEEVDNG